MIGIVLILKKLVVVRMVWVMWLVVIFGSDGVVVMVWVYVVVCVVVCIVWVLVCVDVVCS